VIETQAFAIYAFKKIQLFLLLHLYNNAFLTALSLLLATN